jgi:putative membrane protein
MGFIIRGLIAALGVYLATRWVAGISVDDAGTLILAGLLLGVVNAIVRPIAIVLTFPITIVTLGLFLLVINAAMFALVAAILPGMHLAGFHAAFWGALIVSITGWIGSFLVGSRGRFELYSHRRR